MKKLRIGATVTVSLLGLSFAALAAAGGDPKGQHTGRGGAALAAQFFERLDTNKDGQVARAEAEAEAQRFLDRMDANTDGALTQEEAEQGARALADEELKARFKSLDGNADGRLTFKESKVPAGFFEKLDTNHDKKLTLMELQAGTPSGGGKTKLAFAQADANKDGKVTRAEGTQAALIRFDLLDANRDGMITRAELDARIDQKSKHAGKREAAHP